MTSLHVICGLGPTPIKHPGYAYESRAGAPTFWGTGRSDVERAALTVPVRTRKWFLARFDEKLAEI